MADGDRIQEHYASHTQGMRGREYQNDTLCPRLMFESTAKRPNHRRDESLSRRLPPVLPDELILEILVRLPARSLLQFKHVCKSWKTLISDPQFTKHHLRTSTANPNITHQRLASTIILNHCKIVTCSMQSLFRNPSVPAETFTFNMNRKFHILGSCNGLLCLFDIFEGSVSLWNPTTRFRSKRFQIGLCFETIISYHGFGYDHVSDKYKMLVAVDDINETVTKIYTFGANSWTVIQNFPHHSTRLLGKFVNGALHWAVKKGVSDDQWVIISLDLGRETYGEVLLPDNDGDKISNPVLEVMRSCLCVCSFDSNIGNWVVWLMKEYGAHESWTKLMVIPHVENRVSRWCQSFHPLCISENGVVLLKSCSSRLILCNSNDGRLDYPRIWGKFGLDHLVYQESLVSPQF